jgi:hypothetical protein
VSGEVFGPRRNIFKCLILLKCLYLCHSNHKKKGPKQHKNPSKFNKKQAEDLKLLFGGVQKPSRQQHLFRHFCA